MARYRALSFVIYRAIGATLSPVAWMLLDAASVGLRYPAGPRPARPARPLRPSEQADMWILLGGLETALYQAGFLELLLERVPAPRVIYGGGVAAINAVLAAQHDPRALRRGWERLRGRRFLALEALQRASWMRVFGNGHERLNGALELLVRSAGREATSSSDVWLLTAGAFVEAMCTGRHVPPLASIDTALHSREITGHVLAMALARATAHGVTRILAIVDEPLVGGREAGHALEEISARGIETTFIPFVPDRRPSLVSYLLPGSGAADRVVAAGRSRARAWLREQAQPS